MEEKEQQEFIAWLSDQLQSADEADFQQKVQELGEDGIRQAHLAFKQAKIKQYMTGGLLDKIKSLASFKRATVEKKQTGGQLKPNGIYSKLKNEFVTDNDVLAYKKQGIDFGTKEALGDWLDTWGSQVKPEQAAPVVPIGPKGIRRYNQMLKGYETVPLDKIMAEPNSVTVGQPGAWGKWDTSEFKSQVTPQDTVGKSPYIKNNVQQAWTKNKITHNNPSMSNTLGLRK